MRREEAHTSLHRHRRREDGPGCGPAVVRELLELNEFFVVSHPLKLAQPPGLGDVEDGLPIDVGPEHAGDEPVGGDVEELLVIGEGGDVEYAGTDGWGCVAEEAHWALRQ